MRLRSGAYALPANRHTEEGSPRRVGFELEFANLAFRAAVRVLGEVFGVEVAVHSQAEASLQHPRLGRFRLEVDSALAKQLAKTRAAGRAQAGSSDDPLAEWLVKLTTEFVPMEVVCPPLSIADLHLLDPLVDALREAGAEGTAESVRYAFGLHINTELPSLAPAVIGRYLKAYVIAQDWLVRRHRVDLTRRLTTYIDLYPGAYGRRVLAYDESVTLHTLLDDYLEYNDTRNRALDMLPLFSYLDRDRVAAAVDDPRINARPTFHYRLPNCEIERGDWRLADSWNLWCVLEVLAADVERLEALAHQYRRHHANLINFTRAPWHQTLDSILHELVSA